MKEVIEIAICDDETYILQYVKDECIKALVDRKEKCNIKLFQSGLATLADGANIDILLLDVEMPSMDGFSVARRIKKINKDIIIIFLTSHKEMVQKAFEVGAYRYLYKNCSSVDLKKAIISAVDEIINVKYIFLEERDLTSWIKMVDIMCIEALGEGTALYLKDKTVCSKQPLKHWESILNADFYKCHRAFIVNFCNVIKYENGLFILKNNMSVLVSVRNRVNVKNRMKEFYKHNAKVL